MRERLPDYPPEYDQPDNCDVCGKDAYDCDCPECPACGAQGDPACYTEHGLEPAHDSVHAFCKHIGIEPLRDALRAIDKYNVEHVWIVLRRFQAPCHPTGVYADDARVGYNDYAMLPHIQPWMRLVRVGVGGTAWDGSDWEWAEEVEAGGDWSQLDNCREAFHEALDDHRVMGVPGRVTEWLNARDFTTLDYLDDNLPEDVLEDLQEVFPDEV